MQVVQQYSMMRLRYCSHRTVWKHRQLQWRNRSLNPMTLRYLNLHYMLQHWKIRLQVHPDSWSLSSSNLLLGGYLGCSLLNHPTTVSYLLLLGQSHKRYRHHFHYSLPCTRPADHQLACRYRQHFGLPRRYILLAVNQPHL